MKGEVTGKRRSSSFLEKRRRGRRFEIRHGYPGVVDELIRARVGQEGMVVWGEVRIARERDRESEWSQVLPRQVGGRGRDRVRSPDEISPKFG